MKVTDADITVIKHGVAARLCKKPAGIFVRVCPARDDIYGTPEQLYIRTQIGDRFVWGTMPAEYSCQEQMFSALDIFCNSVKQEAA